MHVFVSDLHMDDTGFSGSVSDADLIAFLTDLENPKPESKITLVFVGDILELLRSPRWEVLWNKHKSAPWSGMGPGFKNFRNGHAEKCAIEIASEIRTRYSGFATKLKELVKAEKIETKYVFGNHDYLVQLSPKIREILVDLLALSHDPKKPFQLTYSDGQASVLATHGHTADPVNWHRPEEGYWALGDAVVLRIVNRFATVACDELGIALETHTGQLLQQLDNIEPILDIPVYVRWLAEKTLSIRQHREIVEKVWKRVVEEFLDIKEFKDEKGYNAKPYKDLRNVFWWSTKIDLAELVAKYQGLFSGGGSEYPAAALKQLRQDPEYRFIVFGHTHEPMLMPLQLRDTQASFYVNTGCWRTVVARPSPEARGPFAPRRISSYFVVDDHNGGDAQERYHLHQIWHAI